MSARDELAELIDDSMGEWCDIEGPSHGPALHAADAILAAAYSKPRTITSVEELDALGQDTVVRDAGGVVFDRDRIITPPHPLRWHPAGVAADVDSVMIALPATVLYEPAP